MSFLMLYSTKEETVFSYDFKPSDIHKKYCFFGVKQESLLKTTASVVWMDIFIS